MSGNGDEWHWQWLDDGTPDEKDTGRVYYERVGSTRRSDNFIRFYKVGDPVVMNGDQDECWIAQIVELFSVRENDAELREILLKDKRKRGARSNTPYELMRVTLRWFYNQSDMNKQTLRRSSAPRPLKNEVYFSDHVEKGGYNDVQVIEGIAWLFPSPLSEAHFITCPDRRYMDARDQTRIVRCFVNSLATDLPVRMLERTELDHLLKHPCTDKNLFTKSRLRLYNNASGAVLKGTGRKRKRAPSRQSIAVDGEDSDSEDDDDDDDEPLSKKLRDGDEKYEMFLEDTAADASLLDSPRNRPHHRRRKVVIQDEDDDNDMRIVNAPEYDGDTPDEVTPIKSNSARKRNPVRASNKALKNTQQKRKGWDAGRSEPEQEEVDEITPANPPKRPGASLTSRKQAHAGSRQAKMSRKSHANVSETIDLDGMDDVITPTLNTNAPRSPRGASKNVQRDKTRAKALANNANGTDKTRPGTKTLAKTAAKPAGTAGKSAGRPPTKPTANPSANDKSTSKVQTSKAGTKSRRPEASMPQSQNLEPPSSRSTVASATESFSELNGVLDRLKAEFQSMSADVQGLFSSKIEWAFEKVIAKVAEVGISNVTDDHMARIVKEIIEELRMEVVQQHRSDVRVSNAVSTDLEVVDM